jgi:hypothetical protein
MKNITKMKVTSEYFERHICITNMDWSHLWLPWNGKPNKIRVDQEKYMKYAVTDIGKQMSLHLLNLEFLEIML